MYVARYLMPLVAVMIALNFSGCFGKDDEPAAASGPIDGSYLQSGMTCDGSTVSPFLPSGALSWAMIVSNTTGSQITTYSSGCVKTKAQVFAYPASNQVAITEGATTCSAGCGGAECNPSSGSGSDTLTYSISGSTYTFSKTDTLGDSGCTAGQTVAYILTKQ
jgi:hypothetical protein